MNITIAWICPTAQFHPTAIYVFRAKKSSILLPIQQFTKSMECEMCSRKQMEWAKWNGVIERNSIFFFDILCNNGFLTLAWSGVRCWHSIHTIHITNWTTTSLLFLLFLFRFNQSLRSLIFQYDLFLNSWQTWRIPTVFHAVFSCALGNRSEMGFFFFKYSISSEHNRNKMSWNAEKTIALTVIRLCSRTSDWVELQRTLWTSPLHDPHSIQRHFSSSAHPGPHFGIWGVS